MNLSVAACSPPSHYEATRAGLDPQLVLGLIQVESGFNKYAISPAGARGLMQVMAFWVRQIGSREHSLFDLTTNLRYGCEHSAAIIWTLTRPATLVRAGPLS